MTTATALRSATRLLYASALILIVLGVRDRWVRLGERRALGSEVQQPRRAWDLSPETFYRMAEESPRIGPDDAPVTLLEFVNYRCGYCMVFEHTLQQVRRQYPDLVAVVVKHLGGTMTRDERLLHEAAECAGEQGLFPEYYHGLLTGGAQVVAHEPWHEVALAIEVPDIRRFDACVRSEKYAAQLQRDNQEAAELGIIGTPTTYMNGLRIEGAMPRADLVQLIAAELRSSGLSSAGMAARGGFPMDFAGSHH